MDLALTDSAVVIGMMVLIGVLGYLMDRRVDRGENEKKNS
jgi:hypothetical protein